MAVAATQSLPQRFREGVLEKMIRSSDCELEWKSIMYKSAAVSTVVAWVSLALGGLIVTGFFSPILLPVTGIGMILLYFPANYVSDKLDAQYMINEYFLHKRREVRRHYQDLTAMHPVDIQNLLTSKRINWQQIPGMSEQRLEEIKPLLAYYLHSEREFEEIQEYAQTLNRLSDQEQIAKCERLSLSAKIERAYLHAMISHHPDHIGNLNELGTLSNPGAEPFFIFNNPAIPPLTNHHIRQLSCTEIGQRLSLAMN